MGILNPVPSGVTKASEAALDYYYIVQKIIQFSVLNTLFHLLSSQNENKTKPNQKALLLIISWQHICLEFGFLSIPQKPIKVFCRD